MDNDQACKTTQMMHIEYSGIFKFSNLSFHIHLETTYRSYFSYKNMFSFKLNIFLLSNLIGN